MTTLQVRLIAPRGQAHWLGEPVEEFVGSVEQIAPRLPTFERLPFGANPRRDMIVRPAPRQGDPPIPIEAVSKSYVLIQHGDVLDALVGATRRAGIAPSRLRCRLKITDSGSRMFLRAELPREFAYSPPDGHEMALTFECFNSVDRTVPFFALLGWLRLVCTNGMVIGEHAEMGGLHTPPLDIRDLEPLLREGLTAAAEDAKRMTSLAGAHVTDDMRRRWVDGPLTNTWGPFAAARVNAIATTGWDGAPARTPLRALPSEREVTPIIQVPGANAPCKDRYGIAQALAWVAARRQEIAESLRWRAQIGDLLARLE